jgi:hypothetical protein
MRWRSARVRLAAVTVCVLSLGVSTSGAADRDGRYGGSITCDVLPGQTVEQLKTEFSMTVVDGRAQYQREVLRPTGRARLGVTERGTGTVSRDGDVSLTGSAGGPTWSYEATYQGRFEGARLRLSGRQLWHLPGRGAHSRPCAIEVSRSE